MQGVDIEQGILAPRGPKLPVVVPVRVGLRITAPCGMPFT